MRRASWPRSRPALRRARDLVRRANDEGAKRAKGFRWILMSLLCRLLPLAWSDSRPLNSSFGEARCEGGQSFGCGSQAGVRRAEAQAEDGVMWSRSGFFAWGCVAGRQAAAANSSSYPPCADHGQHRCGALAVAVLARLFAGALRAHVSPSTGSRGESVVHRAQQSCSGRGLPSRAPSTPSELEVPVVVWARAWDGPAQPS